MTDAAQNAVSLDGKVAVVTGSGSGLGRAEALALAAAGAQVVVNDVAPGGESVVSEIAELGGKAAFVQGDVSERAVADELVRVAVADFGGLDVMVNNAGLVRDRMLFNMSDEEWDTVIRVHLRGHFLLSRNAAAYWREKSKQVGGPVYGRLINTSSEAALIGSEGQPNYAAAKSGIIALTVSASRALGRYGVRANAICPRARTAMTSQVFGPAPAEGVDPLGVEHVTPLVAYLAAPAAEAITGQVFVVHGGMVVLMAAPAIEQRFDTTAQVWTPSELDSTLSPYFASRDQAKTFANTEVMKLA